MLTSVDEWGKHFMWEGDCTNYHQCTLNEVSLGFFLLKFTSRKNNHFSSFSCRVEALNIVSTRLKHSQGNFFLLKQNQFNVQWHFKAIKAQCLWRNLRNLSLFDRFYWYYWCCQICCGILTNTIRRMSGSNQRKPNHFFVQCKTEVGRIKTVE